MVEDRVFFRIHHLANVEPKRLCQKSCEGKKQKELESIEPIHLKFLRPNNGAQQIDEKEKSEEGKEQFEGRHVNDS